MRFVFFDTEDKFIFTRDDAEKAEWTVHQLSISLAFPYRDGKIIQRGMRVGFEYLGVLQLFEIRKAKTYEPDHYQEITAENIVVSELTDDHYNATDTYYNETAAQILGHVLAKANPYSTGTTTPSFYGSLWQVGNDTTTDGFFNTFTFSRGSIWQCVNQIQENWPVRISPRVTYDATGITGRYLDIAPVGGVFRGVRMSLDKNMYEANVLIDDTNVITAMYGYGEGNQTLYGYGWAETDEHPAKPYYQFYIEDPAATAAYGRDGRPRYGFYQNGNINSAQKLLEKTWEALKQAREPKITIDGLVRDMYRLGYADQPIMLYDTVYVEMRPVGLKYALEVSALTVDLLDASNTHVTIGKYYPNIIVIQQKTATKAYGGAGGGDDNGSGQTDNEENMTAVRQVTNSLQGKTLTAGTIKDGDGNMQNVVLWSN